MVAGLVNAAGVMSSHTPTVAFEVRSEQSAIGLELLDELELDELRELELEDELDTELLLEDELLELTLLDDTLELDEFLDELELLDDILELVETLDLELLELILLDTLMLELELEVITLELLILLVLDKDAALLDELLVELLAKLDDMLELPLADVELLSTAAPPPLQAPSNKAIAITPRLLREVRCLITLLIFIIIYFPFIRLELTTSKSVTARRCSPV